MSELDTTWKKSTKSLFNVISRHLLEKSNENENGNPRQDRQWPAKIRTEQLQNTSLEAHR
jgi:hypothetical protein